MGYKKDIYAIVMIAMGTLGILCYFYASRIKNDEQPARREVVVDSHGDVIFRFSD